MTPRGGPLQVVVDGRHLSSIAPWGDLTWTNGWGSSSGGNGGNGCKTATWGMTLPRHARHPLLRRTARVEIVQGPVRRWVGELGQPDWDEGTFRAYGYGTAAANYAALDGVGNATTTPSVAAATAAAAGWPVTVDASVSTTPLTSTTDGVLMLDQLLGTASDAVTREWTVWADSVLRFETMSTTPTWRTRPDSIDLSPAEDTYASSIALRYVDTDGAYVTLIQTDDDAADAHGFVQKPYSVVEYGRLDDATAANIAAGILANGLSQLGWEAGVTLSPDNLMTLGGMPAAVNRVRAGQVVRVHARPGSLPGMGGRAYRDLVIEEDSHTGGSDLVGIKFLGTAARSDDEVVQELFAKLGRTAA